MIGFVQDLGILRLFRAMSAAQWTLRSALLSAAATCLVATDQASPDGVGWFWVFVVMLAGASTFFVPDSSGAAVTIAALVVSWWTQVDEPVPGWLLVFAVGVFVIHSAAALASAGPPTAPMRGEVLRRWSMATALVAFAGVAAWSLFTVLSDVSLRASTVRLVVALVAVALLAWWIRVLSLGDSTDAQTFSRPDVHP
jgi:hypothetical protein